MIAKGAWKRTGHAFSGIFLSADSTGVRRFDLTNITASYASGYIGASLYPDRYSVAVKGSQLGHRQVGGVALDNLFQEFKPEIRIVFRKAFRRK